ncbi:MAG: [LysW]-lysine hydrolase [Chloroflexi bacterium]|nr:[LysW]-lysine hydrolase [Chloroflexota bacterium]
MDKSLVDAEYLTLAGLVSQYSPSGSERSAVEWLISRMLSLGYSRAYVDEAGNAVGVMGDGPRQVILLGHIDTVPGEIRVRVQDAQLYGRGSVDAKGPLACFVDAVAQIGSQTTPGWQFVVIGAIEEERNSEGARYIASRYQPDFAIIGEPNRWNRVSLGYKGSAWADISVKAEQFHSAHAGEPACETVINHWLAVKAFAADFNNGREKIFDQLLLTLRGMESGADGFEQWARLSIGARLPVDLSPQDWYTKLAEITLGAQVEPRGFAVPAWACEKNSTLVRAMLSGIRAAGGSPSFVYKTGTADLNIVAPVWRCPSVVYGPGDSALDHTPDEHIALEEYSKAVQVLSSSLKTLVIISKPAE